MKHARSFLNAPRIDLYPELPRCPMCGSDFEEAYQRNRTIIRLDGVRRVAVHAMQCANETCRLRSAVYRPEAEEILALRGMTFGLDVVVWVGQRRYSQHQTRHEIHRDLRQQGVDVSEREIDYLGETFLALATTSLRQDREATEALRTQGGIVLAMDGVQPEKGNETLYLLRDALSGRVLEGENLLSSGAAEIGALIARVKQLGVPILGVISDKQESLRLAIERELPAVPHQICQFHYLRDLSLPWIGHDRKLKMQMKKGIRGIRQVERQAEKLSETPDEASRSEVVKDYCLALRTVMNDDGKYPLDPPGVQLYERLASVRESLSHCQQTRSSQLLARLITLLTVLDGWRETFERVKRIYGWIRGIAGLLNQIDDNPTSEESGAKEQLSKRVQQIEGDAQRDEGLQGIARHMIKLTSAFLPKLFSYLRDRRVPRTNNDLELFIGAIKKQGRRRRGRKNVQEYVLREGAAVAYLLGAGDSIDWLTRVPKVPYDDFRAALSRFRRSDLRSKQWEIRRDFTGFLKDAEAAWK